MPATKPPRRAIGFPGNSRLGNHKAFDVPPIRRHVDNGLAALDQEFPKRVGVIDSAGESATDSDDSNAGPLSIPDI